MSLRFYQDSEQVKVKKEDIRLQLLQKDNNEKKIMMNSAINEL